jgi:hypothetical protein
MSGTVQANDGEMLPLDNLAQQFVYSGSFISTITVTFAGRNYVQTFYNDGTNIIYITGWITSSAPSQQVMVDQSGNIMVDQSGNIMISTL